MRLATSAALVLLLSCGDNSKPKPVDAGPDDLGGDGFRQVEHLARPGVNEALIVTNDFNLAYNAAAPSLAGVPEAVRSEIVAEAKTVLKALYLGACLVNGVVPGGLSAQTGLHPAGIECHAIGGKLFVEDDPLAGVTLTAASRAKAQEYADKVFVQLIPDVMRIDTSVDSNYLTPCDTLDTKPLLCGGRGLTDDTIDVTLSYLLDGANAAHTSPQLRALTRDGVSFSPGTNPQQGHPNVSATFPYAAPPL